MCKVAGVAGVTDKNRDDVWTFLQVLSDYMTPGNDDGLGYAAFDKKGKIFGEKWLLNETAFTDLSVIPGINAEKAAAIYQFFGNKVLRDEAQAIILHTRAATCGVSISNTHPFVNDMDNPTVAMIHNGVVRNHRMFTSKYSTCDSEVLAHLYAENKVHEDLSNLNKFVGKLQAWYTVLNLSTDLDGTLVMDAYTDTGRLSSYYIPQLGVRVFSTSLADIQATAEFLGCDFKSPQSLMPDKAVRINAVTGNVIEILKMKPEPVNYDDTHPNLGDVQDHSSHGNFDDESLTFNFLRGLNRVTNWRS